MDEGEDDWTILVDEDTTELGGADECAAGEDDGVGVDEDEDARVDVAALELTADVVAIGEILDFVELIDVAAAELLVLVRSSDELVDALLELEDEEGLAVELVVEKI